MFKDSWCKLLQRVQKLKKLKALFFLWVTTTYKCFVKWVIPTCELSCVSIRSGGWELENSQVGITCLTIHLQIVVTQNLSRFSNFGTPENCSDLIFLNNRGSVHKEFWIAMFSITFRSLFEEYILFTSSKLY